MADERVGTDGQRTKAPRDDLAARRQAFSYRGRQDRARAGREEISESKFHGFVASFLDTVLLPPAIYSTFPAGGYSLTKTLGGIMRRNGLKAGMPDILLFHAGRCIGIELKVGFNKCSTVQVHMFELLEKAGMHIYICRDLDRVKAVLRSEGIPNRIATEFADVPNEDNRGNYSPTRDSILGG